MNDVADIDYDAKRRALAERYKPTGKPAGGDPVGTGGVDHLALICADVGQTIAFYTEVVGMTLNKIVPNRDEPSSTHIFLDMGGGNFLAFFDFPKKGPAKTQRGVGSMHHLAMKATPAQYARMVEALKARNVAHDVHEIDAAAGKAAVYFRDPDGILLEVTTGY
ncbi:MAG: VOC family protein [Alphaproteobacteria bacterium]